ncbi:MAG TPA: glycosyltransferase [Bacillales bacterium]|nr:glycosyltransferase [Bacillales bacterium]
MVSIITSTVRDQNIDNVFENFSRQKWCHKELIIILNGENMMIEQWQDRANQFTNVSLYQLPAHEPLGKCLNFAIHHAKHATIAKFDDDDYYSPYYIPQAMKAFKEEQADIVGKQVLYTYLKPKKILGLRKANQAIGGGTISFRKKVFDQVQFPLRNNSEDTQFLAMSRQKQFKIHSTDPYNYVSIRDYPMNHTWKQPIQAFLKKMYETVETDCFIPIVTREPSGGSE